MSVFTPETSISYAFFSLIVRRSHRSHPPHPCTLPARLSRIVTCRGVLPTPTSSRRQGRMDVERREDPFSFLDFACDVTLRKEIAD